MLEFSSGDLIQLGGKRNDCQPTFSVLVLLFSTWTIKAELSLLALRDNRTLERRYEVEEHDKSFD